jgi:putative membrane protein
LIWGLITANVPVQMFFLICVLIAGIYGGITAKRSILYMQALPGLLALIVVYLAK